MVWLHRLNPKEKAAIAFLLAWTAGVVDANGYMVLFRMFTAHMSGNTVSAGIALAKRQGHEALRRAFPIPCFILGIALGAFVIEILVQKRFRSVFSVTLLIEAVVLTAFAIIGDRSFEGEGIRPHSAFHFYAIAALPALAMGLQNVTLRRVGNLNVRTTFITGVLTGMTESFVKSCFWMARKRAEKRTYSHAFLLPIRQKAAQRFLLLLLIWLGYISGALIGAISTLKWHMGALILPILILVLTAFLDLLTPLTSPERRRSFLRLEE